MPWTDEDERSSPSSISELTIEQRVDRKNTLEIGKRRKKPSGRSIPNSDSICRGRCSNTTKCWRALSTTQAINPRRYVPRSLENATFSSGNFSGTRNDDALRRRNGTPNVES